MKIKLFNKKAEGTGLTLTQAIGIVMAVTAIIALTYIIVRLSSPFFGKQGYDATKNNFDELTDKVQEMLDKQDLAVERFFPYFIETDYALIAFGTKGSTEAVYGFSYENPIELLKPDFCREQACLCLYKDVTGQKGLELLSKPETKEDNVLHCKSFEGDILFFTIEKETSPLMLFVGGKLGITTTPPAPPFDSRATYRYVVQSSGIKKGTQNLYLEKQEIGSKIYFYITVEDDETQRRHDVIKGKETKLLLPEEPSEEAEELIKQQELEELRERAKVIEAEKRVLDSELGEINKRIEELE